MPCGKLWGKPVDKLWIRVEKISFYPPVFGFTLVLPKFISRKIAGFAQHFLRSKVFLLHFCTLPTTTTTVRIYKNI